MRYWKGAIEITADAYTNHLFRNAKFFTPHYYKDFTWYCIVNNYAVKYFKMYGLWYKKNVVGYDEVEPYIRDYIDYCKPKEFVYDIEPLPGITYKEYQEIALTHMLKSHYKAFFLGQGTGKTLTTIGYLKTIAEHEEAGMHIVVTPANVKDQYSGVAKEYLPDFVITSKPEEFQHSKDYKHVLLVTNYEQLHKIPILPVDTLVLDESHYAKSFTSLTNQECVKLGERSESIYLFTGTPQDKNKHELLAQFKIFNPLLVPNKTQTLDRYFVKDDYGNPAYVKALFEKELDEIITKLTYGEETEKALDLPPMKNYIIETRFKDKTIYNQITDDFVAYVDGHEIIADRETTVRIKQRQLCSGFITTEDGTPIRTENPKEATLRSLILELPHGIIFTNFDYEITLITEILASLGRTYDIVNGKVYKTAPIIAAFKRNAFEFLIINVVSGSAGLDLSNTNNVIFYSLPNSMTVFNQARYRIRRIGQTKVCNYYYIIVKGTVEKQKLIPNLRIKRERHVKQYELYRRN